MEGEKGTVCVTGGAGYIGSWLIMRLLQRGYNVRATVRLDPELKRDISHLTNLPGASEKLEIFDADLNQPNSFHAAINGCIGVFHVAHPINYHEKTLEESMIKMAVEGTLGILKACVNSKTVKRVVCTSSSAAVIVNSTGIKEMDENCWTDVDFCKSINLPGNSYTVPKTLAERAALEFAEEHGLDLVTLIPSLVIGPFICPHFPTSMNLALALIMGKRDEYFGMMQMVHIDDVVMGHIFLMECPSAKGRYICSSVHTTSQELAKFLSAKYKEFEIHMDLLKDIKEEDPIHLSSKKLLDLGFKFKYGLDEMFDGAIQSCKEKGFL